MTLTATTSKGIATREAILLRAMEMARVDGLEGLTIGRVASGVAMSKSGVFAHFGSREDLQLAVLDTVAERFRQIVFLPALEQPRGLPRLRAVLDGWMAWERVGCPMLAAVIEFDDRPGPVRDRIADLEGQLRQALTRTVSMAVETGELRPDADPPQLAFELFGIIMALHHDGHLFDARSGAARARRAFERLFAAYAA